MTQRGRRRRRGWRRNMAGIALFWNVLALVCCGSVFSFVTFNGLSVDPDSLQLKTVTVNSTQRLNVYCNVTSFQDEASALMTLTLSRRLPGQAEAEAEVMANASRSSKDDELEIVFSQNRSDLAVELSENYSSLSLTLRHAGCHDVATYACDVIVLKFTSNVTVHEKYDEDVKADTRPWRPTISGTIHNGKMVLICSVFSMTAPKNFRWTWQHQQLGSASTWEGVVKADVRAKHSTPEEQCTVPDRSILRKSLNSGDSNGKYRCFVENLKDGLNYTRYAAVFDVGLIESSRHVLYYVLGAAIAGLLFVLVIFGLIYWVVNVRRRQQDDDDFGGISFTAPATNTAAGNSQCTDATASKTADDVNQQDTPVIMVTDPTTITDAVRSCSTSAQILQQTPATSSDRKSRVLSF